MIGIIDGRVAQCEALGVRFRSDTWAEVENVLEERPDVVIVATGGLPHTEVLAEGNELVHSTWDMIGGDVRPGQNVLIYDDAGDHAGLQAAEIIAASGAKVEIMTRDRAFAPEVMTDEPGALYARPAKARRVTSGGQVRAVRPSTSGGCRARIARCWRR